MNDLVVLQGKEYASRAFIMERLGVAVNTFYSWKKKGLLPNPIKLGKFRYYAMEEVEKRLSLGE